MKRRLRFGIRTLLVVMTIAALLTATALRLRNKGIARQHLVSWEYRSLGLADFDSYESHSEPFKASWLRSIENTLAGGGNENNIIAAAFKSPIGDDKIREIISLFPEIKIVRIDHKCANPTSISYLSRLPKLNILVIVDGQIDLATMKAIGRLPQHPETTFQNIHLDDDFLGNAVQSGIRLCSVYSPTSSVSDIGLQSVSQLKLLSSLSLKNCSVSSEGLRALQNHPSLRAVYLTNCPVGDEIIPLLATLPQLNQLSLEGTKISDDGIKSLLTIAPSMHELNIRQTQVSKVLIESLRTICRPGALKY